MRYLSLNMRVFLVFCVQLLYCCTIIAQDDVDTDGDGLSDFHEQHKYLTNAGNSDSDGDGIADGEWLERREYQYVVRSVVQVMRPVTIDYLNDDYQDARVLDESTNYVELEVIHYPFNRVASSIQADPNWRNTIKNPSLGLARWPESGPTADWTPELQAEIRDALSADGIDIDSMNDRELVEKISTWLLKRAEYQDGFSCFSTAFGENGKPYVPEDRKHQVGKGSQWTPEQQWEREISAAGMFRNRMRGSCSSSAIYLNGCLRAVGIPTRTVLCIPVVDANDDSEIAMIRRLKQSGVRNTLLGAIQPLKGSWASHTYNEVWVGGRWRRLNYDRLGQNTYDPGMFGLMTQVATFRDWADARMWDTIGRRGMPDFTDHPFDGPNPYSMISLRDEVGVHCNLELPQAEVATLTIEKVHWTDSPDLPEEILENCKRRDRFGLIVDVTGFRDANDIPVFLAQADLRVFLEVDSGVPEGVQANRLGVGFDSGCYWVSNNLLRIYVPFGGGDLRDLVEGATYAFHTRNENPDYRWLVPKNLAVTRTEKPSR